MSFVLFVVGAVAAAAGLMMIGFGIPINEFSLGNTLIIAGSTLLSGGLVVIALSVAIRQLGKVAELLASRPAARPADIAEPVAARPEPAARMPQMPPRPPLPAQVREPAYPEQAFGGMGENPDDHAFQQPRLRNGGPPIFEAGEDVTLSPRAPQRAAEAPAGEPRAWRPPGARRPSAAASGLMPEPPARETAPPRPAAAPAHPEPFEHIWPPERRAPASGPAADEPPHLAAAQPPRAAPEEPFRREPVPAPPQEPSRATVLKSGVVDGMAYTLYTDGSIEAELAQGVVRFGSIEELRNHLEKSA